MRGCLTFILLVVVVVGAMAWVGLPTVASTGITAALAASGLSGTDTKVTVTANPPLDLATLHADRVEVQTTDAHWNDLTAATLDITLDNVSLAARSFATIDGRMTGATLRDGALRSDLVTISGSSAKAHADIAVSATEVQRVALNAAEQTIGTRPGKVTLAPPDQVTLQVAGRTLKGRLVVNADGLLLLVQGVGSVPLVGPSTRTPLTLTTVKVTAGGGLLLGADLDLGSLVGT
jgi:hypothetical protein